MKIAPRLPPIDVVTSADFAQLMRKSPVAVHIWLIIHGVSLTGDGRVSHARLARLARVQRSTVCRALELLREGAWIDQAEPEFDENGARLANRFRIRFPAEPSEHAVAPPLN